jgi:hypothetical protein
MIAFSILPLAFSSHLDSAIENDDEDEDERQRR